MLAISDIVNLIFIFIAGVSFLGFLLNAFFNKLKITNIIPLLLIGIIIGPVLNLVNTGPGSTFAHISPFAIAVTIAVVLFDVGINIRFRELRDIFVKAASFVFSVQIITGIALSAIGYYVFGLSLLMAMVFGLAMSGTSSIAISSLMRNMNLPGKLKTTLLFESVITDVLGLIVPLVLIVFIVTPNITGTYIEDFVFTTVVGSIMLGAAAAFAWLYLLKKLGTYSKGYLWILTLTLILAVYGFAQEASLDGALAVFFFGLTFGNIGAMEKKENSGLANFLFRNFYVHKAIGHIRSFHSEIAFFISVFFFVYVGLLFNLGMVGGGIGYYLIGFVLLVSLLMLAIRYVLSPLLSYYMTPNAETRRMEHILVAFSYPRGMSPAIIAAVLVGMFGAVVSGVADALLLMVLVTNIISGVGIFFKYKPRLGEYANAKGGRAKAR